MSEAFRTIKTIDDLKIEFQRLLKVLEVHISNDFYPRNARGDILTFDKWRTVTFDSPIGDATPFIEMKNGQFNFIISERGSEYERVAGDSEEMLELIFEGITFTLAVEFELRNRVEYQDSRRLMFAKQIELLELLNPSWAARESENHQIVLLKRPYNDKI